MPSSRILTRSASKKISGIDRLERPVLPRGDLLQDGVGHRAERPIDEQQGDGALRGELREGTAAPLVAIENVIQMRAWHGYARLIDDLRVLGYHVEPMVLDAQLWCPAAAAPAVRPRPGAGTTKTGSRYIDGSRAAASILDPPGTWPTTPLRRPGRAAPTLERADRAIAALGTGEPFLIVYYGTDASGGWQRIDRPLRTLTTLDRFGLVTWVDGEPRLRMLQVPELKRAMGFGDGYDLAGIGLGATGSASSATASPRLSWRRWSGRSPAIGPGPSTIPWRSAP